MVDKTRILEQIEADKHNLQIMVNMLPEATKTEHRELVAIIKRTVKSIHHQKILMTDKVWEGVKLNEPQLFECEATPFEHDFENMESFFGNIDENPNQGELC